MERLFFVPNDCSMRSLFEYPGFRILAVFLKEPYREFYLREVASHTRVSVSTVKAYLDSLVSDGFLLRSKRANLALFKANMEDPAFKHFKIAHLMRHLRPLIRHLRQKYEKSSIILYGSCARGEDDKDSDIDLLIIGRAEKVELTDFEKKFNRTITVLVYSYQDWEEKAKQDEAFYESIITDGLVTQGNLPVIKK